MKLTWACRLPPVGKPKASSTNVPTLLQQFGIEPLGGAHCHYLRLAAFCCAFFSRRGRRDLFFFASLGIFGLAGARGGATGAAAFSASGVLAVVALASAAASWSAFFFYSIPEASSFGRNSRVCHSQGDHCGRLKRKGRFLVQRNGRHSRQSFRNNHGNPTPIFEDHATRTGSRIRPAAHPRIDTRRIPANPRDPRPQDASCQSHCFAGPTASHRGTRS
jgi:hypothetical protein